MDGDEKVYVQERWTKGENGKVDCVTYLTESDPDIPHCVQCLKINDRAMCDDCINDQMEIARDLGII